MNPMSPHGQRRRIVLTALAAGTVAAATDVLSAAAQRDRDPKPPAISEIDQAPADAGTWSFKLHEVGPPYGGSYACKHTALICNGNELIQCGGDFDAPDETAPNGARWVEGSTRRDMYAADATQVTLAWKKVQSIFMPDLNGALQEQGPLGPDQVIWYVRTAVTPHEFVVAPGYYRDQYTVGRGFAEYSGDSGMTFKWLRPGWQPIAQRRRLWSGDGIDKQGVFARCGYDTIGKFGAYHESTDSVYTVEDRVQISAFDHRINDWRHVNYPGAAMDRGQSLIGRSVRDDRGRALFETDAFTIACSGGYRAFVGDWLYFLGFWHDAYATQDQNRDYLFAVNVLTLEVKAYTMPVPFTAPGDEGTPDEHSFLVALNGKIVVAVLTYGGVNAGDTPIWIFEPATAQWTNGQPTPRQVWGNAMVAVPEQNAVYLMGYSQGPAPYASVYTLGATQALPQSDASGMYTLRATGQRAYDTYGAFHDAPCDDKGRGYWCGQATHQAQGSGENIIQRYDPGAPAVETVYPSNGNTVDFYTTDNMPRWFVPGYKWLVQFGCFVFDTEAKRVIAGNLMAGGFWSVFDAEGNAGAYWGIQYMTQHDWSPTVDAGVFLGSFNQAPEPPYVGVLWKSAPGRLGYKVVTLPPGFRPLSAQNGAKCRGDWLYVMGCAWAQGAQQNRAFRLNLRKVLATPADSMIPTDACEWLPEPPGNLARCVTSYDSVRDVFLLMGGVAVEFDPKTGLYRDVTPANWNGWVSMQAWFDARTKAHYLFGGLYGGNGIRDIYRLA